MAVRPSGWRRRPPRQHAGIVQRLRPRQAAGHVVLEQPTIEGKRDAEVEGGGIGPRRSVPTRGAGTYGAHDTGQPRAVERDAQELGLAGAGPEHDELLDRLGAGHVLGHRARERGRGQGGRRGLGTRRPVGAVGRTLHQPDLLDVARERGLRHDKAARGQALSQLFLAPDVFVFDDVADGGLAAWLHKYPLE
jgi:hypothetical protein